MRIRFKSSRVAVGVGLATTVVFTVYLFAIEPLMKKPPMRLLELQLFDWRMRSFNRLRPDPSIVHVDIDDGALRRVGRWPWPREKLAGLIREINGLGAARVVVDLLLSERERPSLNDPRDEDFDVDPNAEAVVGVLSEANKEYGDLELAEAMRSGGNVILGVHSQMGSDRLTDPLGQRIRRMLLRDFTLAEREVAERLGLPAGEIGELLAGVKSRVARERVRVLMPGEEIPPLEDVRTVILGAAKDRRNSDRRDVTDAYRYALGLAAFQERLAPIEEPRPGIEPERVRMVPPYFLFARAARGVGGVNFDADADEDSGVRRIAALGRVGDAALLQLGVAAARDALGMGDGSVDIGGDGALVMESADGKSQRRVPLDDAGRVIIPWTATGPMWRQGGDFPHISAAKIFSIFEKRKTIAENKTHIDYLLADYVIPASKGDVTIQRAESGPAETGSTENAHRKLINELLALEQEIRLSALRDAQDAKTLQELRERQRKLTELIKSDQRSAIQNVKMQAADLASYSEEEIENDAELKSAAERFLPAAKILREEILKFEQANVQLEKDIANLQQELRPRLDGKTVFIGFAATAQGDIVPTPIDPQTLGVMAHANVCNAILQQVYIRENPRWVNVLICLGLGAAACVLTSRFAPRLTLAAAASLMVVYAAFVCRVQFMERQSDLALAGPSVNLFLTWAMVTLFRQLTAEREKRAFSKQLGQYTSPAIAARIAADPEAVAAFKAVQTRTITNYFSDLAGFTSLTEREDPQIVQYVLNQYLDRMSRVIWRRGGLVNKFMGDGIMAFYNSSVLPLDDHVRVACETTLEMSEELEAMKREHTGKKGGELFQQLAMRSGLSTGPCMVGDLGSDFKADYTVIGDVVNLAARLEPANKVFGTQVIVSGPVRDAVQEAFEFRYMAELQVKGKQLTVPVYELICRKGQLTEQQAEYVRRFEAGVELYKEKKWDLCIVHFTRILARKFDDLGASRYIDACQEMKSFPPDENEWRGALELKEK